MLLCEADRSPKLEAAVKPGAGFLDGLAGLAGNEGEQGLV